MSTQRKFYLLFYNVFVDLKSYKLLCINSNTSFYLPKINLYDCISYLDSVQVSHLYATTYTLRKKKKP